MTAPLLRWKIDRRFWTVIPTDHYMALQLSQNASDAEIDAAYDALAYGVPPSALRQLIRFILGQSPARLKRARDELKDPASRAAYDAYLSRLRQQFQYPPQG